MKRRPKGKRDGGPIKKGSAGPRAAYGDMKPDRVQASATRNGRVTKYEGENSGRGRRMTMLGDEEGGTNNPVLGPRAAIPDEPRVGGRVAPPGRGIPPGLPGGMPFGGAGFGPSGGGELGPPVRSMPGGPPMRAMNGIEMLGGPVGPFANGEGMAPSFRSVDPTALAAILLPLLRARRGGGLPGR